METAVYLERMAKLRGLMAREGTGLYLAGPSPNLFYLTGSGLGGDERLLLLALPEEGEPFILANLLYRPQVESLPVKDFAYWKDGEDPFALLRKEAAGRKLRPRKIALEPGLPALFSLPLGRVFPEAEFVLGGGLTGALRRIKERVELDLIRRASDASDRALEALVDRGAYWIGKTEGEFNGELRGELQRRGLKTYDAIVAAGANAAVPHHITGNTVIEAGKGLLVDFGGSFEGYHTDCTRTFHVGKPDREFEKVHRIVLEAHLAAEEKALPGNTLGEVDAAARGLIEKAGYGEYFTHRTGHGIGVECHEGEPVNRGVETPIQRGMVFSIEPGIYLPGRLGVRIENLAAPGEGGALHRFPRELRIIG
jgi:Xaa-Pro dipeptidase